MRGGFLRLFAILPLRYDYGIHMNPYQSPVTAPYDSAEDAFCRLCGSRAAGLNRGQEIDAVAVEIAGKIGVSPSELFAFIRSHLNDFDQRTRDKSQMW
jgi:hypothetical protein